MSRMREAHATAADPRGLTCEHKLSTGADALNFPFQACMDLLREKKPDIYMYIYVRSIRAYCMWDWGISCMMVRTMH
jgi:hypothetical protein